MVEVPATVDKNGMHGVPLGNLPAGFAGLLMNQVAVHDLTAEAILQKSKALALQALLVDPMVNRVNRHGGDAGYDDRLPGEVAGILKVIKIKPARCAGFILITLCKGKLTQCWTLPVIPVKMPGMPHNWYVTAEKLAMG